MIGFKSKSVIYHKNLILITLKDIISRIWNAFKINN